MTNSELQIQLGNRIKELRKQNNITQMDLAYSIGMSMNTVSYIELGKIAPKIDTLNKIAQKLNINIYELFITDDIIENKYNKYSKIVQKINNLTQENVEKLEKIIDIIF